MAAKQKVDLQSRTAGGTGSELNNEKAEDFRAKLLSSLESLVSAKEAK